VLLNTKPGLRDANEKSPGLHPLPYRENVRICHLRRHNACRRENRSIVCPDILWENVDISACIFISEIFLREYFDERVRLRNIKRRDTYTPETECPCVLTSLGSLCLKILSHICSQPNGTPRILEYRRIPHATAVPLIVHRGTRCINLDNTSLTDNMYLQLSLKLLRAQTSSRFHSQTYITLFTEEWLRVKRLLIGR